MYNFNFQSIHYIDFKSWNSDPRTGTRTRLTHEKTRSNIASIKWCAHLLQLKINDQGMFVVNTDQIPIHCSIGQKIAANRIAFTSFGGLKSLQNSLTIINELNENITQNPIPIIPTKYAAIIRKSDQWRICSLSWIPLLGVEVSKSLNSDIILNAIKVMWVLRMKNEIIFDLRLNTNKFPLFYYWLNYCIKLYDFFFESNDFLWDNDSKQLQTLYRVLLEISCY